jgi:hypothetical protein
MSDHSQISSQEVFKCVEESVAVNCVCGRLRQLNEIIAAELLAQDLWRDDLFAVFHLTPTFHELFSMVHGSVHDSYQIRQKECFRLAAILYVTNLRAKFDFEPGAGMLYGTKLQAMLDTQDIMPSWDGSSYLLIWILTVASCSECLFDDLRHYFVLRLSESVLSAGISTFQDLVTLVKGVTWSDGAFGLALRALESQIGFRQ